MTAKKKSFSKGDWVVHPAHGIGRVRRIEKKTLGGKKVKYFRVESKDSIFWVPVEQAKESRIRPVASRSQLKKALKVLKKTPQETNLNYKQRQALINKTTSNGSLSMICELVRDLSAIHASKPLGDNDRRSLIFFKNLLLHEWSICVDVTIEDARTQLNRLLRKDKDVSINAMLSESSN